MWYDPIHQEGPIEIYLTKIMQTNNIKVLSCFVIHLENGVRQLNLYELTEYCCSSRDMSVSSVVWGVKIKHFPVLLTGEFITKNLYQIVYGDSSRAFAYMEWIDMGTNNWSPYRDSLINTFFIYLFILRRKRIGEKKYFFLMWFD